DPDLDPASVLADDTPSLRRTVSWRLGELGPGGTALARSAAVLGDGSSLYSVQSLWTASTYGVGVLFVVLAAETPPSPAEVRTVEAFAELLALTIADRTRTSALERRLSAIAALAAGR
ncbi:MAG: hypothetical protein JOY78_13015, partial [Pseudonocardia sp.]|nr:hypothetical protein [Pseudonocardia sp.]